MLKRAEHFTDEKSLRKKKGLFLTGEAGIGKTHLTIGMAKRFLHMGIEVILVTPETVDSFEKTAMKENQVWILDDFNHPHTHMFYPFHRAIRNVYENGGKLIVTSNQSFENILYSSLSNYHGNKEELMQMALKIFSTKPSKKSRPNPPETETHPNP